MSHDSSRGEEERSGGGSSLKRHWSHSESLPGGSSKGLGGKEQKREKREVEPIQHLESSYEKLPPGLIKENETKPEDCIPDVPGNENTPGFLAHAPTKGLWMPLGKEVKVTQCWRCKGYGHRAGDKECPFFIKGNQKLEQLLVPEDSMYDIRKNKRHEKEMRMQQLKKLLEDSIRTQTEEEVAAEGEEEEGKGAPVFAGVRKCTRRRRGRRRKKKRENSSLPNQTELD